MPLDTCSLSSHFTCFLYATETLLAAALVMIPRVGGYMYILGPCWPFKQTLMGNWQFIPPPQPHWFLQPEVVRLYLPGAGTLGCLVWTGAKITNSQDIPPNFNPPYVNVEPSIPPPPHPLCPGPPPPPVLLVWMNVASLNPWLSDFHTF